VSTAITAILVGGPFDGRGFRYPGAPDVLVMSQYVESPEAVQPGLRYFDYHRDDRRRDRSKYHQPTGPVYYVSKDRR